MIICIVTLFPEMFQGPFDYSIVKRAKNKGLIDIVYVNPRDFGEGSYHAVDERPYGGGAGMILRVDVLDRALTQARKLIARHLPPKQTGKGKVILLDPQGKVYSQAHARSLSRLDYLILVCGHYEGVDERLRALVDEEISIGDYVLTGGELPAMVVVDSVFRLITGVLKPIGATLNESFSEPTLLEYPQYTQPRTYKNMSVPAVLLSGNHAQISQWQRAQAKLRTVSRRPDLTSAGIKTTQITGQKGHS